MKAIFLSVLLILCINLYSQSFEILKDSALRLTTLGKHEQAVTIFEKAFMIGEPNLFDYYNCATTYAKCNNKDMFFLYLNKAIDNGYLKKKIILGEEAFFKYQQSEEWKKTINRIDARLKIKEEKEKLPVITKAQMYSDFDTLLNIITEVNPQIEVRKKVQNYDIISKIKDIRNAIDTITSTKSFIELVYETLTICQDGHAYIYFSYSNPFKNDSDLINYNKEFNSNLQPEGIALTNKYSMRELNYSFERKFNICLKYIDGEYYNIIPFEHEGKFYDKGLKLVMCDNKDIHQLVNNLVNQYHVLKWDFKNHRFYSNTFWSTMSFYKKNNFTLSFEDGNKNLISGNFKYTENLIFKSTLNESEPIKNVDFFEEYSLLYIRIPKMINEDTVFYKQQIIEKTKNKKVKKIIIDVRGNGGGSDFTWMAVLRSIIKDTLKIDIKLRVNNSPAVRRYLVEAKKLLFSEKFALLDNKEFLKYDDFTEILSPNKNSLKYDGIIYVFQDEITFSAAGSLSATASYSDKMITIGTNTGSFGGRGISPWIFMLPNTKLFFHIEPVIDITNVKTPEDLFHASVEILIQYSVEDYFKQVTYSGNIYSKKFLLNHDPIFRKALELK